MDPHASGAAPVACTLDPSDLPERLAAWRSIVGPSCARHTAADGTVRIELGPAADVERLARLVVAEQACCAFLSFAILVDFSGVALEVRSPDGAAALVAALLDPPA